ncbi:MAG TPA: phosphoribosylglycinamide formyltransferase [Candidatus Obscuribacter sp.]|nr:phosphoribosylglycinamide formyltransferase [Candidatus Obscuribacter sp.]HMX46326.1 phosphoribosylglycinamide formyltransferase [Candidatus Obscuribacter sp.]HMY03983.1 phosphoribosylglycinamide formyltransferase [Candidatus Obscuribacter sp.]HNB14935.1 phosphoribosylglycinamide formyltransferase [Candidatus Obscuribacter sp.]HNG18371.1 phosphoribosylglycinamide formyltransferase [Candidatus Obscuribacter sp.]
MSIDIVLLASGRGSNVEAIADSILAGRLDARISCVISNNADAGVLDVARRKGLTAHVLPSQGMKKAEHEEALLALLAEHNYAPDFVVLCGYMRILTGRFLRAFLSPAGFFRVINIHPSLLPSFPGATAYADAYKAGVAVSGITVHLVDEQVDHGPILAQVSFPRHESDSFEDFSLRGLALEHKLLPEVLARIERQGGIDLSRLPFDMEELLAQCGGKQ